MQCGRELVLGDRPSLHGLPQDRLRGTKFLLVAQMFSKVQDDVCQVTCLELDLCIIAGTNHCWSYIDFGTYQPTPGIFLKITPAWS
jgi:hypothetical protein